MGAATERGGEASRSARGAGGRGATGRSSRRLLEIAIAAAALVAAVAYRAWPLPLRLAGRIETGEAWGRADQELVAWILSWVAHSLTSAPMRLFDANIFHPAGDALARSEHLLGLAPFALPVFALTGNPQVTHNATVLLVVLVGALGTFVAVRAWSGSASGAFLAAVLFALAPMNTAAWNRLHSTAVHLFPWVMFLAWRSAIDVGGRAVAPSGEGNRGAMAAFGRALRSSAPWLAVATAFQLLAGIYVAFELAALLAAFLPAVVLEARRRGQSGWRPLAAVLLGALPLALVAPPYLRVLEAGGLPDYSDVRVATLAFDPVATFRFFEQSLPWPFWLLAAVGALARGAPWRLRAGLAAVALAGFALALGPGAGLYAIAQRLVPGFSAMRAPIRFLILPLVSLAMLAGIGVAALAGAWPRGARAVAAASVVAALAVLVLRPAPPFTVAPAAARSAKTYAWLRDNGEGRAVLEIPVANDVLDTTRLLQTTGYMLGSTTHWLPLVNGYSGHPPPSDRLLMTLAQRLPDAAALAALRALADPGWIVVHRDDLGRDARVWDEAHLRLGLPSPLVFGRDLVFRLPGRGGALEGDLLRALGGRAVTTTLAGLPQTALPAESRLAALSGDLPASLAADRFVWFWVDVRNDGRAVWPGLTVGGDGAIGLRVRWRRAGNGEVVREGVTVPLARDLAPGESLRAQAGSWVPPPGDYDLEVDVVQSGSGWFSDTGGRAALRKRITVTAPPA